MVNSVINTGYLTEDASGLLPRLEPFWRFLLPSPLSFQLWVSVSFLISGLFFWPACLCAAAVIHLLLLALNLRHTCRLFFIYFLSKLCCHRTQLPCVLVDGCVCLFFILFIWNFNFFLPHFISGLFCGSLCDSPELHSQIDCISLSQQHSMPHPFGGGVSSAGGVPTFPEPPAIFFPAIPERPVSFSPPPTGPPKGYNTQRRKSTSILEAHTRHFQPAYPRYGSTLHPFSGMETVEGPSLFMVNPGFAAAAQRVGPGDSLHFPGQSEPTLYGYKDMKAEHEEAVRRLSLNQAALLDHYEAMAYAGYPMTAHQLGHLSFHHQRQAAAAAAGLGFDPGPPPQPGFIHPQIMQRISAHSPIPPTLPPMAPSSSGSISSSSSEGCFPPQHTSSSPFPISAPPVMADAPPAGSVFEFHLAAAAAAAAADPNLLASRIYRARRSSMDLPLEDSSGTGSGGSGTYNRLQPVTEELYAYISPELPLPPGNLLLHHIGLTAKDRSPEPSSDSLASSDAGEFQSPPPPNFPPQFDSSAAQTIPRPSSSAHYNYSGGALLQEPQGHPPSVQNFFPPTPSSELPTGGTSSAQPESLQSPWPRQEAQHNAAHQESLQAAIPPLVQSSDLRNPCIPLGQLLKEIIQLSFFQNWDDFFSYRVPTVVTKITFCILYNIRLQIICIFIKNITARNCNLNNLEWLSKVWTFLLICQFL